MRTPCCSYNHKARGATTSLASLDVDSTDSDTVTGVLLHALKASLSIVPVALELFGDNAWAADSYIGIGVAVTSVTAAAAGTPVFAALAMEPSIGLGLKVGLGDAPSPASVQPLELSTTKDRWHVNPYMIFCTPPAVAPRTAYRVLPPAAVSDATTPLAVRLESYNRLGNDAPDTKAYVRAGDLYAALVTTEGRPPELRTRTLYDATRVVAYHASTYIAQCAERGGELPRLDATYQLPPGVPLRDAIAFAVRDAAGLLRRGLVTTPLLPLLRYQSSCMSSLFALHYAALRAVHVTDARQFATLAATLSLSTTAALLRDLTTGRASGHGAPSLALCTALGRPPAGLLPPTAALLAQELGLPDTADGYDVLIPPPNPRFAQQTVHLDPAVLRAEKWAEACAQLHACTFLCHFVGDSGIPCGRHFATSNLLHAHLEETGHHGPPLSGGFYAAPVRGEVLIWQELSGLSNEQVKVPLAAIATGRHILLGGDAGAGKTVTSRAFVGCARRVFGADAVGWLAPTNMSVQATSDPDARTLHAAAGFGVPGNNVTIAQLVDLATRRAPVKGDVRRWRLLVVDEVWRLSYREWAAFLQFIKEARSDEPGPTGLLQILLVGDVAQLLDWTRHKLSADVKREVPVDNWLLTPLAEQLNLLVFELTEVRRQTAPRLIAALRSVRRGDPWKPGNEGFDYFSKECSAARANARAAGAGTAAPRAPAGGAAATASSMPYQAAHSATAASSTRASVLPGLLPTDIIRRDTYGVEYPTLRASEAGYVTLVATHTEEREANSCLREEARARAGRDWRELTITAMDAKRCLATRQRSNIHLATEDTGGGAPHQLTLYLHQAVTVAFTVKEATNSKGEAVVLPSGLVGRVVAVTGSSLKDVKVTVHFNAAAFPNAGASDVTHEFGAMEVDDTANQAHGEVPTRCMVQLRDGAFMSVHRAQSMGIRRVIVDCKRFQGLVFAAGLLYTALSRSILDDSIIVLNIALGENRTNARELAWVAQRVRETRDQLAANEILSATPLLTRDVASFLAKYVRAPDAAARTALALMGRPAAELRMMRAIGEAEAEQARAMRRRQAAEASEAAARVRERKRLRHLATLAQRVEGCKRLRHQRCVSESDSGTASHGASDCTSSRGAAARSSSSSGDRRRHGRTRLSGSSSASPTRSRGSGRGRSSRPSHRPSSSPSSRSSGHSRGGHSRGGSPSSSSGVSYAGLGLEGTRSGAAAAAVPSAALPAHAATSRV